MEILEFIYTKKIKKRNGDIAEAEYPVSIRADTIVSWALNPQWSSEKEEWEDNPKLFIYTNEPSNDPPCYHTVSGPMAVIVYKWLNRDHIMSDEPRKKTFKVGKLY